MIHGGGSLEAVPHRAVSGPAPTLRWPRCFSPCPTGWESGILPAMKLRRITRWFWLLGPLLLMVFIFTAIVASDRVAAEARLNRGAKAAEKASFAVTAPSTWSTAFAAPRDWLDQGMDAFGQWDQNPWKGRGIGSSQLGQETYRLAESPDPADKERLAELRRLAGEWRARLLERFPGLSIHLRDIPPDKNALLRWQELATRLGKDGLVFPENFRDHSRAKQGPVHPDLAAWIETNRTLLDEIRTIGLMPDSSLRDVDLGINAFGRLTLNASKALLVDARLSVDQGDIAGALESVRAVRGLSDHLMGSEAPTRLHAMIANAVRNFAQEYTLGAILPAVPPDQLDPVDWQAAVNPTPPSPADYARVVRGEWNAGTENWLLPALLNPAESKAPPDPDMLVEAYTRHFDRMAGDFASLPPGPVPPGSGIIDDTGLSWRSRQFVEVYQIGGGFVRDSEAAVQRAGFYQAAFDILAGKPVPVDPVSRQPYRWNPATRELAMPEGAQSNFGVIKPLILPKR